MRAVRRPLLAYAAGLAAVLLTITALAVPASAIPDGGASPDTPGTSASVSGGSVVPGGTIGFRVSGFPAGETVYIKIDDGLTCSSKSVHGACVVHQQAIPGGGTVSGSFVLPTDIKPGRHWLRFLASEELTKGGKYVGTQGYTCRGNTDFTVVAGGSGGTSTADGSADSGDPGDPGNSGTSTDPGSTEESESTGSDPSTTDQQSSPTGDTPSGEETGADPGSVGGTDPDSIEAGAALTVSKPSKKERARLVSAAAEPADTVVPVADDTEGQAAAAVAADRFPWIGTAGLLLVAGIVLGILLGRRRHG
ncbi:hypothetical protein [Nocardioides insulae]|uniref:hypothetical protein n=1 Tax=Nocardioides insulae TaxID=394734 RepID=UPI00048B8551|nr:hypothetical protein [Nocardioides insulae]